MAATTGQLGLVTPTQGTLSGTWGDTVNNGITEYVNIAIAGTLSFAGDGAITLANTTGTASASNIGSTTAQYMVIRITGTLTTTKIITGPSYSKIYLVDNAATGGTVTFKASGQTGVSVAVGEKCFVYYNGTDYVKTSNTLVSLTSGVTGVLPIANGGSNATTAADARTNFGATTLGSNLFTITNPSAVTFPRFNADNTVSALNASDFRTAIGAGTGGGTVTSVTGTAPVVSSGGATPAISMAAATASVNGYMTSTYAAKLDGIAAGATNVTNTNQLTNGAGFITGSGNTTGSAGSLATTNFSISEVGGVLVFKYGATTIATMDSSGNLTTLANMTAYGSI